MSTLSLKQAAEAAGKSVTRLRQAIAEGKLKAGRAMERGVSVYVIKQRDLDAYLKLPDGRTVAARMTEMPAAKAKPARALEQPRPAVPLPEPAIRVDAPPPRFQVVDLPTNRPPCTSRAGSQDFRKHQRPGRY